MIPGIDVSKHQGTIDWVRVARSGVRYAFVKATEGDWREPYVDPKFERNVDGALGAGLLVGCYHFARRSKDPNLRIDALREAEHFCDTIRPYYDAEPYMLPPVMDIEWDKRTRGHKWTSAQTVQWCSDFMHYTANSIGRTPIVYTGINFWRYKMGKSLALAKYPLWLAQPHHGKRPRKSPRKPIPGWPPTLWQHSFKGRVDGIKGPVDLDWFMGFGPQLEDLAKKPAPVTPIRPGADTRPAPRLHCDADPTSARFWGWVLELLSRKPRRSSADG